MPRIEYKPKRFRPATLMVINRANDICRDYARQGYSLTVRQVYYQFVSRGWMPNRKREYDRLKGIVSDARLAGLIDWDHIVDRTRSLQFLPTWDSPSDLIEAGATQFRIDKWADQPTRIEVWIEKDALVGVIEQVCRGNQVSFFSCRGYTSSSSVWGAAQRVKKYLFAGQDVTILHLGDHDPSGLDMTRDIQERMDLFIEKDSGLYLREKFADETKALAEANPETPWGEIGTVDPDGWAALHALLEVEINSWGTLRVDRIALNMNQVLEYSPPPNFAKESDSRYRKYVVSTGQTDSWELDALAPPVLVGLIQDGIDEVLDQDAWDAAVEVEEDHRSHLKAVSEVWEQVVEQFGQPS